LALAVAGCSSPSAAPGQQNHGVAQGHVTAQRDVAAEVSVPPSALDGIARERGIGREQALELGEEDALFAQHLSERDPQRASWLERVVLARQLLAAFAEAAEAGGPPTDAEVQAITDARFWELDRPRMVQVVHAVVLSADADPEAKALAERIAGATSQASDATAFLAAARAVEAGRFSVKAESLPPVTPDGRAVDPAAPPPAGPAVQHFDHDFTAAAQRLTRPGEQSPVVRSAFGYHVLYLVKAIEPRQPSLDERRALLHDEIMSQRATALAAALLEQQRRELQPSQSRSAIASMQQFMSARSAGR
jgi:peptidyl-prolyl cis-trans isomerase C